MTHIRTIFTGSSGIRSLCFAIKNSPGFLKPPSRYADVVEKSRWFSNLEGEFDYSATSEFLKKCTNPDSIPWKKVKTDVASFGSSQISLSSNILRICLCIQRPDIGLAYYRHLKDGGEDLSLTEYALLLKVLAQNPDQILENEELVMKLYNNFKPHLEHQELLHQDAGIVFSCFKSIWKDLVNVCLTTEFTGENFIAAKAFHFNEPEIGWKLWNNSSKAFKNNSVEAYFEYCIEKAKEKKFSVDLINDIVSYCQTNGTVLPNVKLRQQLSDLFSILNSDPDEKYYWSFTETEVNDKNVCLSCRNKLNAVKVTNEDLELLKSRLLTDLFINKNINLKTSENEVKRFLMFLKTCPRYDMVIDGLNIIYKDKKSPLLKVLNYLEKKKKKVLVIGKSYLKSCSTYPYVLQNCQVFLTDNRSDDDVFVMYAALNGGCGTGFITCDYLRGYSRFFNDQTIKKIFQKWQKSHQCLVTSNNLIKEPCVHSHLPQKTEVLERNEKIAECWHLSSQIESCIGYLPQKNFFWICLTARPKKYQEV